MSESEAAAQENGDLAQENETGKESVRDRHCIAEDLSRVGFRMVPLAAGTNRAIVRDWPRVASSDPAKLAQWRRDFAGCNWGLLTGNGVGVIDLDTKNDPQGFGGYSTLIDVTDLLGVDLSSLPVVSTASGAHLYFRYRGTLPSRLGWLPFIDVKADGGHQVAAPGTVRDWGGRERIYRLIRGSLAEIPYAPDELVRAIREWRSPRGSGTGGSPSPGSDLPSDLEATTHGLPLGSRNDMMHRLACRWWRDLGLSNGDAVRSRAYQVWLATGDRDSFPWSEVLTAVASAEKHMRIELPEEARSISAWLRARSES